MSAEVLADDKPIPSITLSITQDDVRRVLDASKAVKESLLGIQEAALSTADDGQCITIVVEMPEKTRDNGSSLSPDQDATPLRTVSASDASACSEDSPPKKSAKKRANRPLHEMVHEAARRCEHPLLGSFFDKMKAIGATSKEVRAGVLIFHDMEEDEKIKLVFDVLSGKPNGRQNKNEGSPTGNGKDTCDRSLTRDGALVLFRSIIFAINSCLHRNAAIQIEMEKKGQAEPEQTERPTKRTRIEEISPKSECTKASLDNHSVPTLGSPSPSFDSIEGISKESDAVQKEFEEIAIYAADRLSDFALGSSSGETVPSISFEMFQKWHETEGFKIVPWLELLHLSKWQPPTQTPTVQSAPSSPATVAPPKDDFPQAAEEESRPTAQEESSSPSMKDPPLSTTKPSPVKDLSPQPVKEKALSPVKEKASPSTKAEDTTGTPEDLPMPESPHLEPPSPAFYNAAQASRTVVSFDFTGSVPASAIPSDPSAFCISITEENLWTLRTLVETLGWSSRPSKDMADVILRAAESQSVKFDRVPTLNIDRFHRCLDELILLGSPMDMSHLDRDVFSTCFVDFFSCFENSSGWSKPGEVPANDLAVGFCFLCSGNKSAKLAAGFELMETRGSGGLTAQQLTQFLRSYLTMLVGISLLTSSPDGIMKPKLSATRRNEMLSAVEHGAKWTLGHFLKTIGKENPPSPKETFSFETFAGWYTEGGFNVAPWLELLDLSKLLSLAGGPDLDSKSPRADSEPLPPFPTSKPIMSKHHSPRRSRHGSLEPYGAPPASPSPAEVLFTFPLANRRSLVVLREDATYVRSVVEQLGLLSQSPDEVWTSLFSIASKRSARKPQGKNATEGKAIMVNKMTFVEYMQATIHAASTSKKRSSSGLSKAAAGAREVLVNFFHSFDLHQIDLVALNELMGGLTLLCGGKKSTKLAFAFGVFDKRVPPKAKKGRAKPPPMQNSLSGEDLFLFLRSFLIVMFSCCRQSWDLSDDAVGRYIADTANMVTDDVMRYQWTNRKRDRVDFDEFGEWYNEGGFETAPWLELLDLKKWVLCDNFEAAEAQPLLPSPGPLPAVDSDRDYDCPPPPPEDSVDPSFFTDDDNAIMPMDSIDEMDILLMQPSQDKESDVLSPKLSRSFSYSPRQQSRPAPQSRSANSLKFQLITEDDHGGYMVSVSQKRIRHLRHVLMESGIYRIDGETACKQILGKAQAGRSSRNNSWSLTNAEFDSTMRGIISSSSMSVETQRALSDILAGIFYAFDRERNGTVNALEVACGFTVLCGGKKSDKLEYAFEVLDRDKRGSLSKFDTARYLRSFLTVLLNIATTVSLDTDSSEDVMTTMSGGRCDRSEDSLVRAVEAGCSWAASQAFKNQRSKKDAISFDEFAEWYTHVGYSNIPWLELLDLHKWVVGET